MELFGKVHPELTENAVFVAEINIDKLQAINTGKPKYKEISKFPIVKKDIALVVDKNVEALELAKTIKKACGGNLKDIEVFDVYEGKGIEDGFENYDVNAIRWSKRLEHKNLALLTA